MTTTQKARLEPKTIASSGAVKRLLKPPSDFRTFPYLGLTLDAIIRHSKSTCHLPPLLHYGFRGYGAAVSQSIRGKGWTDAVAFEEETSW